MKIAVINTPFSTHIGRMEHVFRALRDGGHEIELWGNGATEAIARRHQFGFRELPLQTDFARVMNAGLKAHEVFTELFFAIAREQLARVLEYCDRYAPDVIECNARVFSGTVASLISGIPVVTHCCSGLSFSQVPQDLYGFCVKGTETPRQRAVMERLSDEFFKTTDAWFNANITRPWGLAPVDHAIGLCSPQRAMAHSIRELSRERIAQLPNVHLTGPIVTESPESFDFAALMPYCYLSLGTSPWSPEEIVARYRTVAQAIPPRYQVVIGLGGMVPRTALGLDDARIHVFEQAPQIEAIRHAEFVVCHGGCQSVHEALYFGKPLIGIPHHAEVSEMVNAVELNGAGLRIAPSQVSDRTVAAAIERITGQECVGNAARLASLLRATDGLHSAVRLIESVASGAH